NSQRTDSFMSAKERVANDNSRHCICDVSELVGRANIAGCENPRIGCTQMIVNLDAGPPIIVDSGGFESEAIDGRHTARRYQHFVKGNAAGATESILKIDNLAVFCQLRALDLTILNNLDSVPHQRIPNDLSRISILARQNAWFYFEQGDK